MDSQPRFGDGRQLPLYVEQRGTLLQGHFVVNGPLELRKLIERLEHYLAILEAEESYERDKKSNYIGGNVMPKAESVGYGQ